MGQPIQIVVLGTSPPPLRGLTNTWRRSLSDPLVERRRAVGLPQPRHFFGVLLN
jgi:hypothetical protein